MKNNTLTYELNPIYGHSENYSTDISDYEIVGTSYWNKVMPLVRYCTKDYGKIENNTIAMLEGRSQEFLVTKNDDRLPGMSVSIDKFIDKIIPTFDVKNKVPSFLNSHKEDLRKELKIKRL